MTYRFVFVAAPDSLELRLVGPDGAVAVDLWALAAPDVLLPGVDLIRQLEATGEAIKDGEIVLIEHRAVAALSPREATQLGFPPLADAVVRLAAQSLITKPDFRVALDWATPLGQPIIGAERIGAFLRVGRDLWRIPDALFAIAEGVDALNAADARDSAARFAALAALRELLPTGAAQGLAEAKGLIGQMTIAVADAFSLDFSEEGPAAKLVPVLFHHRVTLGS